MALAYRVAFYPESYLVIMVTLLANFNQSLKTYKVSVLGIYENYNSAGYSLIE